MADGTLIFDTELDSSGLQKGIKETSDGFNKTGGVGSKALGLLKAGAVAAGAAVVKLGVDAVKAYSEYEQLAGGVQKLFGDASDIIMKNAQQAYKTAGMSANQYMEQATSFSASLINSLNGDAQKAAQQADVAMRAISDNVNTFGSNMQDVQNAFQGFAKGNFTMLDNLKLGYGGTRGEMERLIEDANKWAEANGKAADLSIDSFSDIVTAIDYIQQKQGIAGTTAKEAASTIQGSFGMMQAAWQNLQVAMANPDADINKVIDEFTESVGAFGKNLVPIIGQFAGTLGTVITGLVPDLVKQVSGMLPALITAASNMVLGLAQSLPSLITTIVTTVKTLLPQIIQAVLDLFPQLVSAVTGAIPKIANAVTSMLPFIIGTILKALPQIIQAVIGAVPQIVTAITQAIPQIVDAAVEAIPMIVDALIGALPQIVDVVVQATPQIIKAIVKSIPQIVRAVVKVVPEIVKALVKAFPQVIKTAGNLAKKVPQAIIKGLGSLASAGAKFIQGLATSVQKRISALASSVVGWAKKLPAGIKKGLTSLAGAAKTWISGLGNAASSRLSSIAGTLASKAKALPGKIKGALGSLAGAGRSLIQGLWNGISAKWNSMVSSLKAKARNLPKAVKKVLGINSPSKVFAEVGLGIPEGLALGIEDNFNIVENAMKALAKIPTKTEIESPLINFTGVNANGLALAGAGTEADIQRNQTVNQTVNFYQPVQTPAQTARKLKEQAMYGLAITK